MVHAFLEETGFIARQTLNCVLWLIFSDVLDSEITSPSFVCVYYQYAESLYIEGYFQHFDSISSIHTVRHTFKKMRCIVFQGFSKTISFYLLEYKSSLQTLHQYQTESIPYIHLTFVSINVNCIFNSLTVMNWKKKIIKIHIILSVIKII